MLDKGMAIDNRPQVNIRAEPDAIALWHKAAKVHGLSLSAWLRMIALRAARKDVKDAA